MNLGSSLKFLPRAPSSRSSRRWFTPRTWSNIVYTTRSSVMVTVVLANTLSGCTDDSLWLWMERNTLVTWMHWDDWLDGWWGLVTLMNSKQLIPLMNGKWLIGWVDSNDWLDEWWWLSGWMNDNNLLNSNSWLEAKQRGRMQKNHSCSNAHLHITQVHAHTHKLIKAAFPICSRG